MDSHWNLVQNVKCHFNLFPSILFQNTTEKEKEEKKNKKTNEPKIKTLSSARVKQTDTNE